MQSHPFRIRASFVLSAMLSCAPAFAQFDANLLINAGAEGALGGNGGSGSVGNLPGWEVTSGEMMAIAYSLGCPAGYPCPAPANPGPSEPGLNHFAGGNSVSSVAAQTVNLSFASASLAAEGVRFSLSGWLGGYGSQNDNMNLSVSWFNPLGIVLGTSQLGAVSAADRGNATGMLYRQVDGFVPAGSVAGRVTLTATRVGSGTSNDGYADNLSLVLTAVPEPATVALFALGLATIAAVRHRRA